MTNDAIQKKFADCEQLFQKIQDSGNPDDIALTKDRIAEVLLELEKYIKYMNRFRNLYSAADRTQNAEDAYTDAVLYVIEHYNPSKGKLSEFFCDKLTCSLRDQVRSFYKQRLILTAFPVLVYQEMDTDSPVLRQLEKDNMGNSDHSLEVHDLKTYGAETWYKIRHQQNKNIVTGYIRQSDGVRLEDMSLTESLEWENEEGETVERSDLSDLQDSTASQVLEKESFLKLGEINLLSLMQIYLNQKPDSALRSGELTKAMSFRMLYTEYLVITLHEYDAAPAVQNGKNIIKAADLPWLDYFMEDRCRTLAKIVETRRHSIGHFAGNSEDQEIALPAPLGVRAPFLQNHLNINRNADSIGQSFSRHKKDYDKLLKTFIEQKTAAEV